MAKYVTHDVLDQLYKLYARPHLDYGDVIYHRDDAEMNSSLKKRLESVQYSAALAVAGTTTNYQMNLDGNTCITDDGSGDFHIFTA